ncbi:hypothetical protein ADK70_16780 [Streptomyces rimosus subsp. pseudoverticillatus]|nr:hypothetical protein ADK70_16780 [Streptomyces rimosus subsp. pseudoverticillatus]
MLRSPRPAQHQPDGSWPTPGGTRRPLPGRPMDFRKRRSSTAGLLPGHSGRVTAAGTQQDGHGGGNSPGRPYTTTDGDHAPPTPGQRHRLTTSPPHFLTTPLPHRSASSPPHSSSRSTAPAIAR